MITSLSLFIKPLWIEGYRWILIKIELFFFHTEISKWLEWPELKLFCNLCVWIHSQWCQRWFLFYAVLYMWVVIDGWWPFLCKEKWGYLSSSTSRCEVARCILVLVFMSLCFMYENRRLNEGLWQSCSGFSLHLKFQSRSKSGSGKEHLSH